ncbi:MAG TPA: FtsX-like permease family protein [Halanaerobiaceae bacterium]|jgi:putative ABC transport system permease protein|nr:ABC transporter permease [Bacillota bacterium]HHU93419.1 FtsX-like permease family protein [Halanaerobiaceae bacterium]
MFLETLKIALRSLYSNKLRTFLSMLGIIIGVAAVIAIISIAAGSRAQVTSSISEMGSNLITISPGFRRGRFGQFGSSAENIFTMELAEAIVAYCPAVKSIAPNSQTSGYFMYDNNNYMGTLVGTTMDYLEINNYQTGLGKFFSSYDLEEATDVIVLGSELVKNIYGEKNPLGSRISFYNNNQRLVFRVIGVMEEKGLGLTGNLNNSAFIPISTYLNTIGNGKHVDSFLAQANSAAEASAAVAQIDYLLSKYASSREDYRLMSQDELLETINQVTGTMTLMLGGIAGISLLVGGIGIMNIMLVSVTERTREVGIRKALGAKRRHILSQFIGEAMTLSSIGGLIGILIGYGIASSISRLGGWPLIFSLPTVILSFGFSLGVGLFFGIYPAYKASRLDPVQALSYE